jgi:hypothetical protein
MIQAVGQLPRLLDSNASYNSPSSSPNDCEESELSCPTLQSMQLDFYRGPTDAAQWYTVHGHVYVRKGGFDTDSCNRSHVTEKE